MNESLLWQIRHFVYQHFADTTHPPSVDFTAAHFNISVQETRGYFKILHNQNIIFIDLETFIIRLADPFTGIPTDFKVHTNGKTYFAKCFWHALGIPAALHSNNAIIDAVCTESNKAVQLEMTNGQITDSSLLIHFSSSLSHTYDDLVFT